MNEVLPIFRWAQSLNHIFIKTKYAHRLDAPGCQDVFEQKMKKTEKSFNLTAKCRKDHETTFFMLSLSLFDKIDAKASNWTKNATDDTIEIILKKKMYGRWPKLFTNTGDDDKPGKALLWVSKHLEFEPTLVKWKDNSDHAE